MVCLKHCTFKMKNGFKSTRHPIKQNRKKWIIVSIYLDAGTLEKPEFNWRSDLPVYFGVEKTLGVFSGSLDVVVLFIFVQRILEYFIPFTSVTNSRTVFICYLWQKTRWFRKKLDSVRQELALLQLLLWYRITVCHHWNKLKTVVRMRSLCIPVFSHASSSTLDHKSKHTLDLLMSIPIFYCISWDMCLFYLISEFCFLVDTD